MKKITHQVFHLVFNNCQRQLGLALNSVLKWNLLLCWVTLKKRDHCHSDADSSYLCPIATRKLVHLNGLQL